MYIRKDEGLLAGKWTKWHRKRLYVMIINWLAFPDWLGMALALCRANADAKAKTDKKE